MSVPFFKRILFVLHKVAEFRWNPSVGRKYRWCNISVFLHWSFLLQAHIDIKFISKEDRNGGKHCSGKLLRVWLSFQEYLLYLRKRPSSHSGGCRRYPVFIFCVKLKIPSFHSYHILCYTYQQVCQVVEIHPRLPHWLETCVSHGSSQWLVLLSSPGLRWD